MGTALQAIPESLIYEMKNGHPIYYQGFQKAGKAVGMIVV